MVGGEGGIALLLVHTDSALDALEAGTGAMVRRAAVEALQEADDYEAGVRRYLPWDSDWRISPCEGAPQARGCCRGRLVVAVLLV